ncbi:hypothetical protein N7474_006587 [Penicillium riverlandense]|uniref:uncharacterized protein n=1 Tax=Penicillium riverlandense TaxID=1903569 RepID=UPI0025480889|nr:uncharacterized protein N7474_006587 [Penicillium riverlandense]KAJ5814810.1 hypothetical protein N7474_006587 [Penicillium riverlandense]
MGVDTRKPILPAPTESIIDTGDSAEGTDLATDLSRRTDKTSYSIPDDGSPVTVSTRRHRDRDDSKLSRSHRDSQTSLLIEYFEGGKGSGAVVSRPSVRVRVTPSSARKSKDRREHIQITESGSSRKPSYTRRISLTPSSKQKKLSEADDQSVSSSNSAVEEGDQSSPRRPPVEIEFVNNRDQGSELSTVSRDTRYMPVASDVSSMPPDSMVEGTSSAGPRRKRSQSLERGSAREDKGFLKTPSRQRSRSLSTERIAHLAAEKLSGSPQEASSGKHRTKSGSKDYLEAESKPSRRRRHAHKDEDVVPSVESSLLSTSAVSSNRRSDQYSIRSGASKSSINNPKLLETVEDAIRRLILPELKELKKDQKVMSNKSKFDRDMTTSYSSTSSRDELGRRLSKHASAPDVMKPKVVLNRDSKDEGIILAGDSTRSKDRKSSKSSETSDPAFLKMANRPELTESDKIRRQRSKGLRDAHAAGLVGTALTAAALNHHDSKSSLDKKERRRKKSGSRKSSGSFNETELVFQKHKVPPMPMRSEIDSELTRDSLLSQRTESPTPRKKKSQVEEVLRGSPRQLSVSPKSRTPTRAPLNTLGMRHNNQSSHHISTHSGSDRDLPAKSGSPGTDADDWAIAAAAAANLLDAAQPGDHTPEGKYFDEGAGRALSPIQSVASDQTETHATHHQAQYEKQAGYEGPRDIEPRLSIGSLSSAPSTNLARSTQKDGQAGPAFPFERSRRASEDDMYGPDDDARHSMLTDADSDVNYLDKIKEGQHVADGAAANPEFVHPVGIESAVASLMDPSVLESQSTQSGNRSQSDLVERGVSRSPEKPASEGYRSSPLKQRQDASSPDDTSFPRRIGATSPPQSVTQSIEELDEAALLGAGAAGAALAARGMESPVGDGARSLDSESEINTNPSIIQGPIGGATQGSRDHWAYDSRSPDRVPYYESAAAQATGLKKLSSEQQRGLDAEYYQTARDIFGDDDVYGPDDRAAARQLFGTPPGAKDEGYVSAANPMSPSIGTPKQGTRGVGGLDAAGMDAFDSPASADDPFVPGHQRHLSGFSHGVGLPLYDSATGRGIERIQSQDIVALMDHLTVRDAQRNARDTEILVTLVRSAAEMRTSFEQMKKFIAQQDDLIMESSDKQHERTQKALGGPRPLPPSGSRPRGLNMEDGEDAQSKRKNVFKRALKGLSLKSGNDLTKIEGMLEQLLEEVEMLRAEQGLSPRNGAAGLAGLDQDYYEPTGPGATTPTKSPAAYLPNTPRPANGQRRDSDRVSPVHQADDEDVELDDDDVYMTEHLPVQEPARHERAGSLPLALATPPRKPVASGVRSTETTPQAADKSRKHKSNSSSIFPKISRWSKTTASTFSDNFRSSMQPGRKERPYSEVSRSGSDLADDAYKADHYDPRGDDRIRSTYTLDDNLQQENRPPSPLVPSQVSEAPKYRAHRGSLDLQHPQPRQGPTGRFQTHLESQAQTYGSPVSPTSDQWAGSNPILAAVHPNQKRYSGVSGGSRLSPISDTGHSETSSRATGPPRPPKVKDEGPLIPERPPKVREDETGAYGGDRITSRSSAMRPASQQTTPPARKPTGPRPLNSSGTYSPSNIKRTRYRGSPTQIDYEDDY